nr:LRR receptor-like serine/threonine-protein kinase FLS2 [Tanacetum cinerariifolium]
MDDLSDEMPLVYPSCKSVHSNCHCSRCTLYRWKDEHTRRVVLWVKDLFIQAAKVFIPIAIAVDVPYMLIMFLRNVLIEIDINAGFADLGKSETRHFGIKINEDLGGCVACDRAVSTHVFTCCGVWVISLAWLKESFQARLFVGADCAVLRARAKPGTLFKGFEVCLAAHMKPLNCIVRSANENIRRLNIVIRSFGCCKGLEKNLINVRAKKDVTKCSRSELEALISFREGIIDPENRISSWKGNKCCQWHGIGCNNSTGVVTSIDLHNPYPLRYGEEPGRHGLWNLSGEISPSLLKLKYLTYFDLSYNTFLDIEIPEFIGSLRNLRYLNLSEAGFSGQIPPNIGKLSHLRYLDVSTEFGGLTVDNLEWLTKLSYLKHLKLDNIDLSVVGSDLFLVLNNLTSLEVLHLSNCGLTSLSPVELPFLSELDLSNNKFNSKFPDWLLNYTTLSFLNLDSCGLYGRIPLNLGELPNLWYVSFAMNDNLTASCTQLFRGSWPKIEIEGGIPGSIGKLCNLRLLDISGNNMTGTLPEFLEGVKSCTSSIPLPYLQKIDLSNNKLVGRLPEWIGRLENLEELGLDYNQLDGQIPDSLGGLKRLTNIGLAGNNLNGTLPEIFGQLSELTVLDVSFNDLTGIVSEAHFLKLSKLTRLQLSSNSPTLKFSSEWSPPFQVRALHLGSCQVGPLFPNWLKTQKEINLLDLSNASISDSIPIWFWDMSFNLSLLNMSHNQIHGQIPSLFDVVPFADVDFTSNFLEGPIPLPSVEIELYSLSDNSFSGVIPYNIGEIMPNLIFLSLASNRLSGEIPSSIGEMVSLEVIDLSNNSLAGYIPSSFGNFSYLKALDLGYNNLSGTIPESFGNLQLLQSLHLNDNNFSGGLASSLMNLSSLETLDLANNRLSGDIPPWLGNNLTSLKILSLRSNSFSGGIPTNLPSLSSLQVLDLGLNNLTGMIPTNLGNLTGMSRRQIMNQYRFYGFYRGIYYSERLVVNLEGGFQEYTKTLLGRIPVGGQMGTFKDSAFAGNPYLCGPPLAVNCNGNSSNNTGDIPNERKGEGENDNWFLLSIGLGFATGILVPWLIMSIRRPWGKSYF